MTAMPDFLARSAIVFAVILFMGTASAASLSLEENDRVIWNSSDSSSERTLNVGMSCKGNITVRKNGVVHQERNTTSLSFNFGPSDVTELGQYTVTGRCSPDETDSESFYIAEMNPEIVRPEYNELAYRRYFMGEQDENGDFYNGHPVEVNLSIEGLSGLEGEGWRALEIKDSELSFSVVVPEYDSSPREMAPPTIERTFEGEMEDQVVRLHPRVPAKISRGYKSLDVSIDYDGQYGGLTQQAGTGEQALYLTGIRTVSMQGGEVTTVPERRITKPDIGGIRAEIFVERGFRKYLAADRFDLRIAGETVEADFKLERDEDQTGLYSLALEKAPSGLPDQDRFEVDIVYDDPIYEGSQPIEIASYTVFSDDALTEFKGYVWDSQRQPVDTVFRSDGRVFRTQSDGRFSQKFVPGEYDFNVTFSKNGRATLNLNDVKVNSRTVRGGTRIGYEYSNNPSGVSPPGIKPIDLVSFRFLQPFKEEGSTVTLEYDVTSFDPTTVTVLACDNWNGGWGVGSSPGCMSSWEKIENTEFSPGWSVTVPAVSYESPALDQERVMRSAYMIGTRSGLRLNGPLTLKGTSQGRVVSGGDLTVQGQLVAAGSNGVEGANVNVTMLGDGEVVSRLSGETDSSGSFTVSGQVPEEPGNYTVELSASKEPYDDFKTSRDGEVWVYREKSMALSKKDSDRWKLEPGKKTARTLVLENDGQTELTGIEISVSDSQEFNTEYLTLDTTSISSLSPGDTTEFDMIFDIPGSCPASGCPQFSTSIDIQAESSEGVTTSLNVGPQIGSSQEETSEREATQQNDTGNGMSFSASDIPGARATGEFLASQSTLNIALGLILVFLMVLAGALKSGDDNDRAVRRNVVRGSSGGSSRPGVQPPKVSPAGDGAPLDGQKAVDTGTGEKDTGEGTGEDSTDQEHEGEEEEDRGKVEKLADSLTGSGEESGDEENESEGEASVECDVCGEKFDTEAGVKLHKETAH